MGQGEARTQTLKPEGTLPQLPQPGRRAQSEGGWGPGCDRSHCDPSRADPARSHTRPPSGDAATGRIADEDAAGTSNRGKDGPCTSCPGNRRLAAGGSPRGPHPAPAEAHADHKAAP